MTNALENKRILIVGGGRGIGAHIARRATDGGADVVVATRGGEGPRLDVLDEASIASAAQEIGPLDHVVTTASAHHDVPVADLEHDKTIDAFGAKVTGALLLAKHFAPQVRPGGSFLLFSGVVGWKPAPGTIVKGIANGALEYVAAHLAVELAPIRVNAIAPGIIDSGTWDRLGEERKHALLESAADGGLVGRHGTLDDIADAALWLLGAGYVSGEVIHVDGGARHR
ncbi:SDR family oxidoreductase [Tsukamurella sp. 8F]|uniref:SDR family oxidoreductase n=1 Tax=unclassified Tsukamurella TaxID=2633480 RepID=UPI0023B92BA5|nr:MULTISPECIES: SDR family oxidoreductase [unclassified Tsukamurella]MDF0530207.1 SDR family oxidoreductase [Tsukamurella sp. 8J]MDF0586524.1 SDR family oxidoreductase [Tsukamurella sp. 8F]